MVVRRSSTGVRYGVDTHLSHFLLAKKRLQNEKLKKLTGKIENVQRCLFFADASLNSQLLNASSHFSQLKFLLVSTHTHQTKFSF